MRQTHIGDSETQKRGNIRSHSHLPELTPSNFGRTESSRELRPKVYLTRLLWRDKTGVWLIFTSGVEWGCFLWKMKMC